MKRLISVLILTGVCFCNICGVLAEPIYSRVNFTDAEWCLQKVIFIDVNASAFLNFGSVRYYDIDNVHLKPRLEKSRLYVPAKSIAVMFNTYLKSDTKSGKTDLRYYETPPFLSDNLYTKETDIYFDGFKTYDVSSEKKEINSLKQVFFDGEMYLPLRALSEYLGQRVYYDNGYILIGKSDYVDEFLENADALSMAKEKLMEFRPKEYTGRSIYVSPSGSDRINDGSFQKPYKTIQRAVNTSVSGDTIYIRGGIYRETVTCINNGNAVKPITIKNYNNEDVLISACDIIDNFNEEEGNIVSAAIKNDLGRGRNQVFINGEPVVEARFPNSAEGEYGSVKLSPLYPTKGALYTSHEDSSIVTGDILNGFPDDRWKGATFVTLHGAGWNVATAEIKSSKSGELHLDNNSKTDRYWFDYGNNTEDILNYGFISGSKNAIDTPGEWAAENGRIYMYKPENINTADFSIEMKSRQLCVDMKDSEFIILDGINTFGGGIRMNDSRMCQIKNCDIKYLSHYVDTQDQREGFIDDGNLYDLNGAPKRGEVGIFISGTDDIIYNNNISYSAGCALYLVGLYTYIENNVISDCGYMGSYVGGIYIGTDVASQLHNSPRGGYVIRHNNVERAGRSVLSLQTYQPWVNNGMQAVYLPCEISFNVFKDGGLNTLDTGVMYFWGATMGTEVKATQFHHNIVSLEDSRDAKIHSMIYHDNCLNTMQTHDNIVYASPQTSYTNPVYVQPKWLFPEAYAVVDTWNNISLGNISGEIPPESYPNGKEFVAGAVKN